MQKRSVKKKTRKVDKLGVLQQLAGSLMGTLAISCDKCNEVNFPSVLHHMHMHNKDFILEITN